MIDIKEQLANRLLKSWNARGLLILEKKAWYIEVEVPFLALDTHEVARAVAGDFEEAMGVQWDKRAFAPGVTVEELSYYNEKLNDERTKATGGYTLAAAILAQRGPAFPDVVGPKNLRQYLHRRFIRGGRGVVDPGPVDFLFLADDPTPVIYANNPLAEITRFSGRECLSMRVDDDELCLRVENALTRLKRGGPPVPRTKTNMEDWLSNRVAEENEDQHEE